MTPSAFRAEILRPWLHALEPVIDIRHSIEAENLLLAIAMQESGLHHRYQVTSGGHLGPARGWWQFEPIGIRGVMEHERTRWRARKACEQCRVEVAVLSIWRAIEGHDGLAVAFARLLLWSDPARLPADEESAWDCYKRNWRPGKPDRKRWTTSWESANA